MEISDSWQMKSARLLEVKSKKPEMKKVVRHILTVLGIATALFLAVLYYISGQGYKEELVCKEVRINVVDSLTNSFICSDDVKKYLAEEYGEYIGCSLDSIDLNTIEDILKSKSAVLSNEAYVTKDGALNIEITQREPIARFAGNGKGYYADRHGKSFPLQKTYASYVMTIDGCIPEITDTFEINRIVTLVKCLEEDKIWKDRIVQIAIDSTGNLTLVPREGKERILFGQPDKITEKIQKLETYYTRILPYREGESYSTVDVRYLGQIVCK